MTLSWVSLLPPSDCGDFADGAAAVVDDTDKVAGALACFLPPEGSGILSCLSLALIAIAAPPLVFKLGNALD